MSYVSVFLGFEIRLTKVRNGLWLRIRWISIVTPNVRFVYVWMSLHTSVRLFARAP